MTGASSHTGRAAPAGRHEQAGSASVLVMAFGVVVLVLTLVVVSGTRLLVAQRRTAAAADLAALAGAGALQRGDPACSAARSVASSNRARLTACLTEGEVVTVRVERQVKGWFGAATTVASRARAGPAA